MAADHAFYMTDSRGAVQLTYVLGTLASGSSTWSKKDMHGPR
jgi:hypothetical protein